MAISFANLIDEFYENPADVRRIALSLDYFPKPNAKYPGGEAASDAKDWEAVRGALFKDLLKGNSEKPIPGKNFKQGKFRLALAADNSCRPDGVHQDQQRYSGIVYLSRNQDSYGGVGLYKCNQSGELSITPAWVKLMMKKSNAEPGEGRFNDYVSSYMLDWGNWTQIGELPMRFNRAIILMSRCFHASTGLFGSSKESGRLTQHFELYL